MTLILGSISQDCTPWLGFETRFCFLRLYLHYNKPGLARQTSFLQGASKGSYILGYNIKNIRLKVSYRWFLKRWALLYLCEKFPPKWSITGEPGEIMIRVTKDNTDNFSKVITFRF